MIRIYKFQLIKFLKICIFICLILFCVNYYINNFLIKNKTEKCAKLFGPTVTLLNNLTIPTVIVSQTERQKLSLKDLVVVSFASLDHIGEAIRSCDSFQQHPQLKNTKFIMYFDQSITVDIQMLFASLCPVAILRTLDLKKYPKYVQNLQQYRFKAIYQALTLKQYKVVLNIDTSVRFIKNANFTNLVEQAIKRNSTDVTLLSGTDHSMFSTIHPTMYSCFPNISLIEMYKLKQYQSGIILWIGSENGWKIMKRFVECALQINCMGPPGAKKRCISLNIFKYPEKFSGCHRFDQAAINLILYEESQYSPKQYQRPYSGFIIERSPKL